MQIVNEPTNEDFTVVNSSLVLVTEIPLIEFTYNIYNPAGTEVSLTCPVIFSELSNGNYRTTFTPDVIGDWYLVVYHSVYFPWGKTSNVDVAATLIELVGNKKILTQISDNEFKEEWFSTDQTTKIREFKITKVGNTETREPISF